VLFVSDEFIWRGMFNFVFASFTLGVWLKCKGGIAFGAILPFDVLFFVFTRYVKSNA